MDEYKKKSGPLLRVQTNDWGEIIRSKQRRNGQSVRKEIQLKQIFMNIF
jgi:hypothetical protein